MKINEKWANLNNFFRYIKNQEKNLWPNYKNFLLCAKHNMGNHLQLDSGVLIFEGCLGFAFGINQKFSLPSSSPSNG